MGASEQREQPLVAPARASETFRDHGMTSFALTAAHVRRVDHGQKFAPRIMRLSEASRTTTGTRLSWPMRETDSSSLP